MGGPLPLDGLLKGRVQIGKHALNAQARGRPPASGKISSNRSGTPVELATWLLSSTSSTLLSTSASVPTVTNSVGMERYAAVNLEVAMRLRYLVPSDQMPDAA